MKNAALICIIIVLASQQLLFPTATFATDPSSANYKLRAYGFGSGGIDNSSSSTYKIFGNTGETDAGNSSSSNYAANNGLTYTMQAHVPSAPILGNGSGAYYNKISITLNTGSNPTDSEFLINISTDNFVSDTTHYVQADDTIGTSNVWQTNTVWGASGFTIINLTPGTTYSVRVSARQGNFTQSPYSPVASQATANPTFSFSVSPNTITNWSLTPNTVNTSSTITVTIDTNATNGGSVYLYDSNSGLQSSRVAHTISSVSNDLTAIGEGYGAQGASASQTTGGPMELISPYNGSGSNVGILDSSKRVIADSTSLPVSGGQATFTLQAKPATTAPASTDYTDTVTVIGSGSF